MRGDQQLDFVLGPGQDLGGVVTVNKTGRCRFSPGQSGIQLLLPREASIRGQEQLDKIGRAHV